MLGTDRRAPGLALALLLLAAGSGCSSDSDPPPTSSDPITSACHAVAQLSCAEENEAACVRDLNAERDQAVGMQCEALFDAYVDCLANGTPDCRSNGTPELPESCESHFAKYHNCVWNYDPACSALPATPSEMTPCETTCGAASATCTATTPLECTCTRGIRSGTDFTISACIDLTDAIRDHCI